MSGRYLRTIVHFLVMHVGDYHRLTDRAGEIQHDVVAVRHVVDGRRHIVIGCVKPERLLFRILRRS